MIPTLIFFLLKRYSRHHPAQAEKIRSFFVKTAKPALVVIIASVLAVCAFSQERTLEYNIKRNGNIVGNIHFLQTTAGNRTTMKLASEVKTRFIFLFTARANEETIYDNGIMTWSSLYRKMNGNVKADKKTKATGRSYTIYKGSKTETLDNYPIRYNMLSMYATEPVSTSKVYSDNFQQHLDIQKIAAGHYKIKFPDGNHNEYFYNDGLCTKIEVHHSLYSATIELKM